LGGSARNPRYFSSVMKLVPADDPIRELCALCRAGKLFAVEEWCRAGKPIEPSVFHGTFWPIGIAIDKRFHSLVEVFLRHGAEPDGRTLSDAVNKGRTEIVKLLFAYGADAKSIPFEWVIQSGDPAIIQMFVERDPDLLTDYPIAQGLIRSPRSLLRLCKQLLPTHPELEFQISMALRHFCEHGSMRDVSLLLWLGANPRTKVPLQRKDDPEIWENSFYSAIRKGHLEMVKKLGFDSSLDDPHAAFWFAIFSGNLDLLKYLLEKGADPNHLDEAGCTAFNNIFWEIDLKENRGAPTKYLTCLIGLIDYGTKWKPQDESEIKQVRDVLRHMGYRGAYDLIKKMKQASFCSDDLLIQILDVPQIRRHLAPLHHALAQLLPFFEKWDKKSARARLPVNPPKSNRAEK
jgi:ankyrin repeat protein